MWWFFFPYFFRKINAEQRLETNLGRSVNIHSVETQPKTGSFSARTVFVSNLQRAREALTQLFGGGARLYTYPSRFWSQFNRVSSLRVLVCLIQASGQKQTEGVGEGWYFRRGRISKKRNCKQIQGNWLATQQQISLLWLLGRNHMTIAKCIRLLYGWPLMRHSFYPVGFHIAQCHLGDLFSIQHCSLLTWWVMVLCRQPEALLTLQTPFS